MQKQNQIVYNYQELATVLIKASDIHEGLWGIYIEFGLGAANFPSPSPDVLIPSAIASVQKIGIQIFEKENNLTVDAAKVNPEKK